MRSVATISVISHDPQNFDAPVAVNTPERVGQHLGHLPADQVNCRPCPVLGAARRARQPCAGCDGFAGARRTREDSFRLFACYV
jgi:hypothetical protein